MQLPLFPGDIPAKLIEIHLRLQHSFATQGPYLRLDPISQLVLAILGGRTHGAVSKSAFLALLRRFGGWDSLRDARIADIQRTIAAVTFPEAKARYIKAALESIAKSQGRLTLHKLDSMTVPAALIWLEALPGVGRKSAAATLNFSTLRKRALVIDSHHLRILIRLRLVPPRSGYAQAYDRIMPLLPVEWTAADLDRHHGLMKLLGQSLCRPFAPHCRRCPLLDLCPAGSAKLVDDPRRVARGLPLHLSRSNSTAASARKSNKRVTTPAASRSQRAAMPCSRRICS